MHSEKMPRAEVLFLLFLTCTLSAICLPNEAEGKLSTAQSQEKVLASVGDGVITADDLETVLRKMPERKRNSMRAKALDDLIEARVFAREAIRAGLDQDPEVQEAIEKETKEKLAYYFVQKRIDLEAEPGEEALREYYDNHQDEFVVPESVRLQQVVVRDEQLAKEILQSLKEGASFEKVAKEKSIVRSAGNGGDAGWGYKGRMDSELEKVVFSLEKNVLSDVIKTGDGSYQVVKVLDRRDERLFPFEDAKERMRNKLFWRNRTELMEKYYKAAEVNRKPTEPGVLVKIGQEVVGEETIAPLLAKAPEEEREEVRRRWIEYFVEVNVFSKEARKVELQKDPEVARDIRIKNERILAQAFYRSFIKSKTQVTDSEIADYYGSHPELFVLPEKVRAKSILVKTREEAEEILRELKDGAAFGSLAQKKSLYPHAVSRAGTIGWFARGEKDPALEKVAFSLEEGQISDVIETADGYEIIKLTGKKGGTPSPLKKVKASIRMTLNRQKFEQEKQLYYQKAEVKVVGS
jgi:EpsD family peptidyl-prolyl cis-trans isomerase